jgi:hypothetical protein
LVHSSGGSSSSASEEEAIVVVVVAQEEGGSIRCPPANGVGCAVLPKDDDGMGDLDVGRCVIRHATAGSHSFDIFSQLREPSASRNRNRELRAARPSFPFSPGAGKCVWLQEDPLGPTAREDTPPLRGRTMQSFLRNKKAPGSLRRRVREPGAGTCRASTSTVYRI